MEKLITLLNEYEKERKKEFGYIAYEWSDYGDGIIHADNIINKKTTALAFIEAKALLISKGYGFVKWLVDNDKIDYEKVKYKNEVNYDLLRLFKKEEKLLMLLSIQDNPINFLISVLK